MFQILKIKKIRIMINFLIASSILLSYYYIYVFNLSTEVYRTVFIFYVIIIFFLLVVYALNTNTNVLLLLFFIANSAFMYGSILFNDPDNVRGLFFAPYYFSTDTYMFMIKNLYFNLSGFVFGILLIDLYSKNNRLLYSKKNTIKKYDKKIARTFFYVMSIALAISLIFVYEKISLLLTTSYLESRGYNSLYLNLFNYFFIPFLFLSISMRIDNTQKKKFIYLLLVYSIIAGFQGARGGFVVSILFYIWYSVLFFGYKINIRKGIWYGLFFILSITILSGLRSDEHKINTTLNVGDAIKAIAVEQGSSVSLIGYYKDYPSIKNNPSNVPFIFGVFNNLYLLLFDNERHHLNATNSTYAKNSSIVGQRIPAITNPDLYDAGAGLGGNYILEEYDFLGFFGIVLLTALYVYILYYLQNLLMYSNSLLFKTMSLEFIYFSFFMPRTQYVTLGATQIFAIFIVYFFYIIINSYLKKGVPSKKAWVTFLEGTKNGISS